MSGASNSVGISVMLFGVLDRVFKDADGKIIFLRLLVVIVLFLLAFAWYKGPDIMEVYKQSRYDTYAMVLKKDQDSKFETSSLEQLQIVHVSSGADFSAIYSFRPRNLNYFVDLIAYEGKLPQVVNEKNLGGFPVDKTSDEYTTHMTGHYFISTKEWAFLPSKKKSDEIKYMFSCPYFNLDNIYSGTVSMYWYGQPQVSEVRLGTICGQAARTLGRIK